MVPAIRAGALMRRLLLAGTAVAVLATSVALAAEQSPAVVKLMTTDTVVEANGLSTRTVHLEITATNDAAAADVGQASLPYRDSMQELEVVEAYTLKARGQKLPISANAIYTQQPQSAPQLQAFDDTRLKVIVFPNVASGDTVVYTARWREKLPTIPGHFTHTEFFSPSATYNEVRGSITAPKSLPLKVENHDVSVEKQEAAETVTYRWRYSANATDSVDVPNVSPLDRWPRILVSSLANHGELGSTYGALLSPKEIVTPRIQALADQVTAGITDRRQQAQKIYEWVSKNIRYVAVDIGNGGIIPHDADVTLANGYGDCKDHAVLFGALLKAKRIDSEVVLINLGNTYSIPEVPMIYPFNHAITWLPEFRMYADTTAGVAPFGTLPFEEYGKPVVHAVGTGGAVQRTPVLPADATSVVLKTTARLDKDGKVTGESTVTAAGPAAVRLRGVGLAIQATGPARFAAASLDQLGVKGTGTVDVPPPTDLGPNYILTSRFEFTDPDLVSGMAFEMIRGLFLTRPTGDSFMGALFDDPQNENEATACFSGRAEEELTLELPSGTPIGGLPPDAEVKTANLAFSANWTSSGSAVTVRRAFTSTIDEPLCTGDVRKETARALSQIRDHYELASISYSGGQAATNTGDPDITAAELAYSAGDYPGMVQILSRALSRNDLKSEDRLLAHLLRADGYSLQADHQQAVADYTEALRLKPDQAEALDARGSSFAALRLHDRAIADYTQAIRLKADDPSTYTRRAASYLELNKVNEAIADYTSIIRIKPDDQLAHVNRAQVYMRVGLFNRSIADCDTAIRLGRNAPDCFYHQGTAHHFMARDGEAIRSFTTVIQKQPENSAAYFSRGVAYLAENEIEKAISDFDAANRVRPNEAGTLYVRAVAKEKLGNVSAAEADFAAARRINANIGLQLSGYGVIRGPYNRGQDDLGLCQAAMRENNNLSQGSIYCSRAIAAPGLDSKGKLEAHLVLGVMYRTKNYLDEAEERFQSAGALDPSSPTVFVELGTVRGIRNDHDGAIAHFTKAIGMVPTHAPAFLNRGIAYRFKGEFENSLKDHSEAVRLSPNNGVYLYHRCETLALMGRAREGLANCDEAIRVASNDYRAWDARGYAHLRAQDYAAAVRDYDSALLMNPNVATSLYGRGIAKTKSGDTAGGSADMVEAIKVDSSIASKMSVRGIVP